MKSWMKWVLYPVGVLLLLVAGLYVYGLTRPEAIRFQLVMEVAAPPEKVFALVADPLAIQKWYPAVEKVEIVSQKPLRYRMTMGGTVGEMEEVERETPLHLVTKTVGDSMGMDGEWDFTVTPSGTPSGAGAKISETVVMKFHNPLMKAVASIMDGAAEERKVMELMKAYAEKK